MAGIGTVGGITSALDSLERRKYEEQQIQALQDEIARANFQQNQTEKAWQNKMEGMEKLAAMQSTEIPPPGTLPDVSAAPGQSSQPMQQPSASSSFAAPPSIGTAPPASQGWLASPSASPALGGGVTTPPQAQIPTQPAPKIPPKAADDPMSVYKWVISQGGSPEVAYEAMQQSVTIRDAQTKRLLEQAKIETEAQKAAKYAADAVRAKAAGEAGSKEPTPTSFEKEAADLYGKGSPQYKAAMAKHISRMDAPTSTQITLGGSGALSTDAKTLAAEQYLDTGQLPAMYRDSKGRAEIINLAAQIQKEKGGDLGDVPGQRASFKADAASLAQRQKFVDAGNQFVANMSKQADLVDKYMEKGAAGGVPVFNKWIQAGRKSVEGDPDVTQLDTAIRGLAREHQRIVTGVTSNAQLHASAQETADQLLNIAQTPAQMRAAIKVMREEAKNAIDSGKKEVADIKSRMKGTDTKSDSATDKKVVHWDDLK